MLDAEVTRFEFGSLLTLPPRLEPDGSVTTRHGRWDVERDGLPPELELRVPVDGGQYYGRFPLKPHPGAKPSLQARLVAISRAGQAGRAFAAAARHTR